MGLVNKYNLYRNKKYLGEYSRKELCGMFGVTVTTINRYAEAESFRDGHVLKKVYEETNTKPHPELAKWAAEWDRLTEPYRKKIRSNKVKDTDCSTIV